MFITHPIENESAEKTAARRILSRGFSEIGLDPQFLDAHVPRIVEGMRLITNSAEGRRFFTPHVVACDEMGWDQDVGLMFRNDAERKFVFHYPVPCTTWPDMNGIEPYLPFLDACKALTLEAKQITARIARAIDAENSTCTRNRYPASLTKALRNNFAVTRVLRYLPLERERGQEVDAYPHIDRGFLTVHWWASAPGLVLFDRTEKRWDVGELSFDTAAVFPGKKFYALTGGAFGFSGIHGVRDARMHRTDDRIAIVTFVHAKLTPNDVAFLQERLQTLKDAEARCIV